jgi:sugar phosphate isomerase/epimerase
LPLNDRFGIMSQVITMRPALCVLLGLLGFALLPLVHADEGVGDKAKESAQKIWGEIKEGAQEVGQEVAEAGQELSKEISQNAQEVWYKGQKIARPLWDDLTISVKKFWGRIVEDKDQVIAELRAENERLRKQLAEKERR